VSNNETNSEDLIYKVSGIAEHLLKGIFSQPNLMGYHLNKSSGHKVMRAIGIEIYYQLNCKGIVLAGCTNRASPVRNKTLLFMRSFQN